MDSPIRVEWLADLLADQSDQITRNWIEEIRAEGIAAYDSITDEQLLQELPPTVESMIYAFRTGDTEGPRKHSLGVIQRRLAAGFKLPDLQMSLHALETAVMRVVRLAGLGPVKEYQALQAASMLYYMVALIAAAVYEQLRSEQQRRFSATFELGATLNKNLELHSILDIAVQKVVEYTHEVSVAILLAGRNGNHLEMGAYRNLGEEVADALSDICESLGCGTANADSQEADDSICTVPDIRGYGRLEPWSEMLTMSGFVSLECIPLMAKQRRLGSMVVLRSGDHTSANDDVEFLSAMAGHIANALQNAILYEEAKGKRELGILLESSRLFASSLETQDVLRRVAKMAAEAAKADVAVVFTRDSLRGDIDTAYFVRSRATRVVRRIVEAVVGEGEESGFHSLGEDFAKGNPIKCNNLAEFPGRLQNLANIQAGGMVVPLRQKDTLLGAIALVSLSPSEFTDDDLALAGGVADLASVAIENARLYQYERNIAATLQSSFLPSSIPTIAGYEAAAYYRPAMAEAEIGGDFYDVFPTSDGNVSVIIGDVSGKGLKAAIPTAMGRYLVRAFATENPLPSSVLSRFNRTFFENSPEGLFMTAFYATLNPRDNIFTYVSAGHNPPLLYSEATGKIVEIKVNGLCLGVLAETVCKDMSLEMQPGDVLLLYTDGATDVKGDGGRLEVEGLIRLLSATVSGSAQQIVTKVSKGISDYGHGTLSDDVALVVLKRLKDDRKS